MASSEASRTRPWRRWPARRLVPPSARPRGPRAASAVSSRRAASGLAPATSLGRGARRSRRSGPGARRRRRRRPPRGRSPRSRGRSRPTSPATAARRRPRRWPSATSGSRGCAARRRGRRRRRRGGRARSAARPSTLRSPAATRSATPASSRR